MEQPLLVEIIAYAPTAFNHCTQCEVAWREMGASNRIHEEQVESSLPADMAQDYERISDWVRQIFRVYCDRILVKVIDAASIEGVYKSLKYNARRLLGMSQVYSLWVNKMLKSREEARSLRDLLSFTKKKEADPLMDYLISFRDRMGKARELLTDPELTAFFFVTLAEALPIAVITRFIGWFHEFGIPVGGVIVNMLIDRSEVTDASPDFVRNRVAMQARYMDDVWTQFEGRVRSIVPLYETEVRGMDMLNRMANSLFAEPKVALTTG